jgi:hypothetical protein
MFLEIINREFGFENLRYAKFVPAAISPDAMVRDAVDSVSADPAGERFVCVQLGHTGTTGINQITPSRLTRRSFPHRTRRPNFIRTYLFWNFDIPERASISRKDP